MIAFPPGPHPRRSRAGRGFRGGAFLFAILVGGILAAPVALAQQTESDTSIRLNRTEDVIRQLNGTIERLEHEVRELSRRLETFIADTDLRFQDLRASPAASSGSQTGEGGIIVPASGEGTLGAIPVTDISGEASPALASAGPQAAYDEAINLLRDRKFPDAQEAFQQFLATWPDNALAGNAQYWLGETFYVRGQYQPAAEAFLTGYQAYADSPKAPDSLLKLGMSLTALGQTAESCATFSELTEKFPAAPQSVRQRAQLEKQRSGC